MSDAVPAQLLVLLESLANRTISDADFAKLDALLNQSAHARQVYLRYMNLHAALPELLGDSPRLVIPGTADKPEHVVDWDVTSREGFLRLLHNLEASDSQGKIVDLDELNESLTLTAAEAGHAERISIREVPMVGRYLLGKAVTSRVAGFSAIAASLVFAVTLMFHFLGGGQEQEQLTQQSVPGESAVEPLVATLTHTRQAKWAQGEYEKGDRFMPGQRLVLTEGAAEITTRSGARAVLQAPCVIELLDDGNSVRLIRGRLAGIVETDQAAGFAVDAPHMRVIDFGTRFGVDASDPSRTQVHVIEGEVEMRHRDRAGKASEPVRLIAGQAAVGGNERWSAIAVDPARFDWSESTMMYWAGTGQGLDGGQNDPDWLVVALDGEQIDPPISLTAGGYPSIATRMMPGNDPTTSQWIQASQSYGQVEGGDKEAVFTCQRTIKLPEGVDPKRSRLHLHFDADDRVSEVRINGKPYTPSAHSLTDANPAMNVMVIDGALIQGANTIELDVVDVIRNNGFAWGLRVQLLLETKD